MTEVWNPYHDVFDDNEDTSAEEDYLNVDESYELTTPEGVAGDFGCGIGDLLFFKWELVGDVVIPN